MANDPPNDGATPSGPRNRLAEASSPYLLLHRNNPVDWYPWGAEALDRARREDRPIFVSVGYSTCHWCHVMERESFSDPAIAALMNEHFVNVKVDREERPDLDEIYMAATQILSQHGGWPNSVFLTPKLKPYFAGTYFPPEDRMGRPGFATVIRSMADAWRERRSDVEQQAESVAEAMRRYLEDRVAPAEAPAGAELAEAALTSLEETFDESWGGFGGAPKFPTPSNLNLLLRVAGERPASEQALSTTLDRMARGGIFDQLGGGFHRYATDREWKIPHFEKMLYDNGLLLEVYAGRFAATGDPEAARVVRETTAFLAREMTSPEGAFWSAIDADSEGREGAYYVWTRDELLEVLGDEDFGFLAPLYGFDGPPFFEDDSWILHLPQPWEVQARRRRLRTDELLAQVAPLRDRLLGARERRARPQTDDKILADWNGTAIAGLALSGRVLGDSEPIARAGEAARFVLERMRTAAGELVHSWRAGVAGAPAFLSDYVFLVRGLLELHRATADEGWLGEAVDLTHEQMRRLGDPAGGFFVAGESSDLLFRSREVFDGALPGANGVAGLNLLDLADRTGEPEWLSAARGLLMAFTPQARRVPQAARTLALAALGYQALETTDRAEPAAPSRHAGLEEPIVEAALELSRAGNGEWRRFSLRLEIAPGWHIGALETAAEEASRAATAATRIRGLGLEIRELVAPPPDDASAGGGIWEGTVEIEGELRRLEAGARMRIDYQPCDERRCLTPVRLELSPGYTS